jgi:hypothetical protein
MSSVTMGRKNDREQGQVKNPPAVSCDVVDLSGYERLGDPRKVMSPTAKDRRRQATAENIRDAVKRQMDEHPPPPLTNEQRARIRAIFLRSTPDHCLMRWSLRLYCGHLAERQAHAEHKTLHAAFTGPVRCPECAMDPAVIIAAEPIGLVGEAQQPPAARATQRPDQRPTRAALEQRIKTLEAELARLGRKSAEMGCRPDPL